MYPNSGAGTAGRLMDSRLRWRLRSRRGLTWPITSAVRDFLIVTELVKGDEIVEENPPAQGSRRAVDLAALDTFIEFKRRIGTAGGFNPNAEYVQQLDDYLEQSEKQGRIRMGILTDGKRWLLRWSNAGPVRTALPYAFTLEDADRWITLFQWLYL